MLTFQTEPWSRLWSEGQQLFHQHYEELALHKEVMPMGLDNNFYSDLEHRRFLLVVTARRDGRLIGYYMAILIAHHPHNKDAGKVCTTDFFYISPTERKGGAGAKLMIAAAKELKRQEVIVASISIKLERDEKIDWATLKMLKALGWEPTDLVLQLVLKGKE